VPHTIRITDPDDYVEVIVEVRGEPVTFVIHPSKLASSRSAVNVEIDGELRGRLRIHMNDFLILDTINDIHEIDDPRKE